MLSKALSMASTLRLASAAPAAAAGAASGRLSGALGGRGYAGGKAVSAARGMAVRGPAAAAAVAHTARLQTTAGCTLGLLPTPSMPHRLEPRTHTSR